MSAKTKRIIVEDALDSGFQVMLHVDGRKCTLPEDLTKELYVWLVIARRGLAKPIPDLVLDDDGVKASLSFGNTPIPCILPWTALFHVETSEGFQATWTEDVPAPEVAAAEPLEEPKRPHLTSVPMPDDEDEVS